MTTPTDDGMRAAAALVVAAHDNQWDQTHEGQMITAVAIWEALTGIHDAVKAVDHARATARGVPA